MYQNYTTGQTALTLNLDFTIPNNHLATVIGWFVDSIPEDVLLGDSAKTGRPAYHPAMMLKILLFAYSRRVFSGRKIALMLEENLPMRSEERRVGKECRTRRGSEDNKKRKTIEIINQINKQN